MKPLKVPTPMHFDDHRGIPKFLCTQPHGINVEFTKFLRQSHRMNLDSLMLFISLSGNVHPYTQLVVEAHFKNIKAFFGIDPRTGCLSSWSWS